MTGVEGLVLRGITLSILPVNHKQSALLITPSSVGFRERQAEGVVFGVPTCLLETVTVRKLGASL